MTDRAILFIDGNNWFHSLKGEGVQGLGNLDYVKISEKLSKPRDWVETRYYIGRVPLSFDPLLHADQRRFLALLRAQDSRISVHYGRLESRPVKNNASTELFKYLSNLDKKMEQSIYHGLLEIARKYRNATAMVEKAVDVKIAVDMVIMSERDEYDSAYLLSADGDFTPAVDAVRAHGRKVYAASPSVGAQLASAVNSFLRLRRDWFLDCHK